MSFSKAGLNIFQTTLRLRYLITVGQTSWELLHEDGRVEQARYTILHLVFRN